MSVKDPLVIYTDGSSQYAGTDKARAGCGIYIPEFEFEYSCRLQWNDQTNQKAELFAIMRALQIVIKSEFNRDVVIYTDSVWCINSLTVWCKKWLTNNFNGGKVENAPYIKETLEVMKSVNVEFVHIKSHKKIVDEHGFGNDKADKLASIGVGMDKVPIGQDCDPRFISNYESNKFNPK